MAARYLALVARHKGALGAACETLAARARREPGLAVVIETERLLVVTEAGGTPIALGAEGAIVGSLFQRGCSSGRCAFDAAEQAAIAASRGERLTRIYWGSYVAILPRDEGCGVDVVRSPFGDLPCYLAEMDGAVALASDIAMLRLAGWRGARVMWSEVACHLAAADIHRTDTCLEGVRALRGGERLHIEAECTRACLWTPWDHVEPRGPPGDGDEGPRRVRDAAHAAVRAHASRLRHPLLLLSGGLDSSIVAACLAEGGGAFSAVNLVSSDPSGDERRYARSVAAQLGCPLIEVVRDVANVDVGRSDAAHLPRPSARSFTQDSRHGVEAVAAELGADGVIDGGGGDNVFCSLQSAAPVADAYLSGVQTTTILDTARNIARLAEAGLARVLLHTAQRVRRTPGYRWPIDTSLLDPSIAADATTGVRHPWLEVPRGGLPGKAGQVALLVSAQSWVEGLDPQAAVPGLSPLVSQPLVEACLRIPTWLWFEDGRNRAVARRAFGDRLPAEVIGRRSKASPDSFVAELFEKNRSRIRGMLLDGRLAQQHLIDRDAIERVLADPRPAHGDAYRRIMRLVDVEAWLGAWT